VVIWKRYEMTTPFNPDRAQRRRRPAGLVTKSLPQAVEAVVGSLETATPPPPQLEESLARIARRIR
jgi:hypothetical protein